MARATSQRQLAARACLTAAITGAAWAMPASAETWEAIAPILADRCTACHSGEFAPLGLSLDSFPGILAGSENGPVVDTATPEASAILRRLTGEAEPRMPLDGPPWLDEAQIAAVEAWVRNGAPGPAEAEAADPAPSPLPDSYADDVVTIGEVEKIFKQRCIECHSRNSRLGAAPEGLHLTSLEAILKGGDRIAVIPGNSAASELIRRVEGLSDPRMPLDGPPWLEDDQIALLKDWIAGGAMDDDMNSAPVPVGGRVRFRGILTAPNAIDGAEFAVTAGTRIDGSPGIGGRAELRGRVAADGSITAERLRDR